MNISQQFWVFVLNLQVLTSLQGIFLQFVLLWQIAHTFRVSHEYLATLQRIFVSRVDDFWRFQLALLVRCVALDFLTVLPLFGPMDFESFEGFGLKWSRSLQNLS